MGTLRQALTAFRDTLTSPDRLAGTSKRAPLISLADVPPSDIPADFLGAETYPTVPGYVFLDWNTTVGVLTAAYPTTERRKDHPNHVRRHKPETRVLIEVAETGFHAPDGPDVHDHAAKKDLWWRDYAHAIGQAAPYWPWNLNHRTLIEQWQPGDPMVTTLPAVAPEPDPAPLLQLAALYPPDSQTAAVLRHFYLFLMHAEASGSDICHESLAEERAGSLAWQLDGKLAPAAVAIPTPNPGAERDQFTDETLRAVFSDIVHRHDTLGEQVARVLTALGVDQYFPFTYPEHYEVGKRLNPDNPDRSPQFQEWRARLDELSPRTPDARFASGVFPEQADQRFIDPETGAPVTKVDYAQYAPNPAARGEDAEYAALVPRRLPTTSPLTELTLDGHGQQAWVRTTAGTLYPMPAGKRGHAWGYSGTGSTIFTVVVERLLTDISAATPDDLAQPQSPSLCKLFQQPHPDGTTFTRSQLEQVQQQDT